MSAIAAMVHSGAVAATAVVADAPIIASARKRDMIKRRIAVKDEGRFEVCQRTTSGQSLAKLMTTS